MLFQCLFLGKGFFFWGDTIVHPWFFRPCCFIGLQDCHFGATIFNKHRRLSLVDGAFWRTWVTSIPEKWLNELLQFMDLCFLWCSKKYNIIYYWLWQKTCLFYVFPLLSQDVYRYFTSFFLWFICPASPNVVTTAQQKNQALFQGWRIGIAPRIRNTLWWKDRWLAQRHSQKSGWIGRGYDKPMPSILSKWYMVVWKSRWWSILWSCFFCTFSFWEKQLNIQCKSCFSLMSV